MLLVLDHGAQLPQEGHAEFHQVLELVEDDDDPFLLALARDQLGLLKNLLEQSIEVGCAGASGLE